MVDIFVAFCYTKNGRIADMGLLPVFLRVDLCGSVWNSVVNSAFGVQ